MGTVGIFLPLPQKSLAISGNSEIPEEFYQLGQKNCSDIAESCDHWPLTNRSTTFQPCCFLVEDVAFALFFVGEEEKDTGSDDTKKQNRNLLASSFKLPS